MTWGAKGKGQAGPVNGGAQQHVKGHMKGSKGQNPTQGYWVWSDGGKGGQPGKPGQSSPNTISPQMANQNRQLKDNCERMKQQLWEKTQALREMEKQTARVLQQGAPLLQGNADVKEDVLTCPVCHTTHHNLQKVKCRNKACKADLRAGRGVPDNLRMDAQHIPKNPLLTNYFQALLVEEGAVECLKQTIDPVKAQDQPVDSNDKEDQDVSMAPPDDGEDKRTKAEKTLEYLKSVDAEPSVIQQQEKILAALPKAKPKIVKATQPLLDCGRLHQALSQATEYHTKMAETNAQAVEKCQLLVQQAQQALEQAKATQAEQQAQADKQIMELRRLINKKQEQTKQVLQVPQTPEEADTKLMIDELQNCFAKANLPQHIMKILENAEIRIGQGPSMSIITGTPVDSQPAAPSEPKVSAEVPKQSVAATSTGAAA